MGEPFNNLSHVWLFLGHLGTTSAVTLGKAKTRHMLLGAAPGRGGVGGGKILKSRHALLPAGRQMRGSGDSLLEQKSLSKKIVFLSP